MGEVFLQDLRYGFRTFLKNPGFALVVSLTLALGIGANTAIFSVVNGVLLRPLPYTHADRTVTLWNDYGPGGLTHAAVAPAEYFDFKEQLRAFDEVAAVRPQRATLITEGAEPEALSAYVVTPNIFDLLGAAPAIGRGFQSGDGADAAEPVVLLSHSLWEPRFGSDRRVIGRQVNISGWIRTVIGVMPPPVRFPDAPIGFLRERADIWIPSTLEQSRSESRGNQTLGVIARIRGDASLAEAAPDLKMIENRFKSAFPRRYSPPSVPSWSIAAVPLQEEMVGAVKPALLVLSAAVGLVLFIACVNVANLLLARAAVRKREMAVRLALGADRSRLLRQMLTESGMLAFGGGLLGIFVARFGIAALVRLDPGNIPLLDATRIDGFVLAFAAATVLFTIVAISIIPALQQPQWDLRKDRVGRRRLRAVLVTVQVAIAVVVLIGAGLLARSFAALQSVNPGFRSEGVMVMQLNLPLLKYDTSEKRRLLLQQINDRVSRIPRVVRAGAIYPLPMSGQGWSGTYHVEGEPSDGSEPLPHAEYAVAMSGYFETMRIPLLEGSDFTAADREGTPRVVIVDETLARRHWPNESAINKRIIANGGPNDWATVIGVVGHVYNSGQHSVGEPQLYLPYLQFPQAPIVVVARSNENALAITGGLRSVLRDLDSDQPISRLAAMDDLVSKAVAPQRFNTWIMGAFAVAALAMAGIGLYGVMSYLVAQRTREIGIRMALGGRPRDVRGMIVRESLVISIAGVIVGCALSLGLSRAIAGLLFGIEAMDLATYAGVVVLLVCVAVLASYGPARRATRVDPMAALRDS